MWQQVNKLALAHFAINHSIKILSDASKDGMGGVLLQHQDDIWCPVAANSSS